MRGVKADGTWRLSIDDQVVGQPHDACGQCERGCAGWGEGPRDDPGPKTVRPTAPGMSVRHDDYSFEPTSMEQ